MTLTCCRLLPQKEQWGVAFVDLDRSIMAARPDKVPLEADDVIRTIAKSS
jgi:hypothetical protein